METARTPRDVLSDALKERPDLVDAAVALFDLAQFLLDDDERLTKSGALDGVGRDQLQQRALELLGGPPATDPDDELDDDDDESSDDADDEDVDGANDDDSAGSDEDSEDDA